MRFMNSKPDERHQDQQHHGSSRSRAAPFLVALLATTALVDVPRALAASTDWGGGQSTDWFTALNWTLGIPTSTTDVNFAFTSPNATVIDYDGSHNPQTAYSNTGYLGGSPGFLGTGQITVDHGSQWLNASSLYVGYYGTGILTIQNGSSVNVGSGSPVFGLTIGEINGDTGTVTVDGTGSSLTAASIVVGDHGTGTVSLFNGSSIASGMTSGIVTVGRNAGSIGTININDGSIWDNTSGQMLIGEGGTGAVNVLSGSTLWSDSVGVGVDPGNVAANTLTVAGASSTVAITTSLDVGMSGKGTVRINNGGYVSVAGVTGTTVGSQAGSTGEIDVWGAGSRFTTPILTVGASGCGLLSLTTGGLVTVGGGGGFVYLAQNAGSTGRLIIGNDSSSPALAPGTLSAAAVAMGAGTAEIDFNHTSANYVFAPVITGNGAIYQVAGTTILTGISSGFTGTTIVNGGTLEVDGALASTQLGVFNGGTLSGTGTVGDPLIMTGGTLSPGSLANPYGTLTITDPLTLQAGAFYTVHLSPSANSRVDVTGAGNAAVLGGATVNAIWATGSYVAKQYTILTAAGGVSGTFGSLVNTNLPANFKASLSYDLNDVYLDLALGFAFPGGLNGNQQAAANALTASFNRTGGIPLVYGGLTPAGLTQASGELATGSQQTTFDAMSQFMGLLTDPFMSRTGGNAAPGATGYAEERKSVDAFAMFEKAPQASFAQRWSVWASGLGGSQSTDGNTVVGSNSTTSRIAGTAVGADYLLSPQTIAGFALLGGGTNFSVNGAGSGRSDLFQAGAYVRHTNGPAYVSAALAYGWQDITTNRYVTISGVDHLRAEFNANAYSGRVEGGYRFVSPWSGGIGLTPYAAAQFTTFDLPAYAESVISGSGAFALAYGAKSPTDTRSELGLRTDKSFAVQDGVLTLRSRFAWAHDFDPDRSIASTFQALPGASFIVNGAAQASDSALTTASLEMKWRERLVRGGNLRGRVFQCHPILRGERRGTLYVVSLMRFRLAWPSILDRREKERGRQAEQNESIDGLNGPDEPPIRGEEFRRVTIAGDRS